MFPINTLVDFKEARHAFVTEFEAWLKLFKPKALIAERFQTRGNGGPLISTEREETVCLAS